MSLQKTKLIQREYWQLTQRETSQRFYMVLKTYRVCQKFPANFWRAITSTKWSTFSQFYTGKFVRDLRKKFELKLSPPSNLLPYYLVKYISGHQESRQLYTHISENRTLYAGSICFMSFICSFIFLPDNDVIMTWLQYSVLCITHSLQLWRQN